MGYGTADTGKHTGRSGEEGIVGIIHRDAFGLDRVYLQAKRYTDNAVGPEAINAFYGALQRKGPTVVSSSRRAPSPPVPARPSATSAPSS